MVRPFAINLLAGRVGGDVTFSRPMLAQRDSDAGEDVAPCGLCLGPGQ